MRYRKLDDDGDMRFGSQQADFFRDVPEAVAQSVETRLALWQGEWFFDLAEGTPYATAILGHGTDDLIEPAMRHRIGTTPGVTSIESFSITRDLDARSATIAATINTQFGPATVEGAL